MVKALSFKGDPKTKKRKRTQAPSSDLLPTQKEQDKAEEVEGEDTTWTFPDTPTDLSGPLLLVFPSSEPLSCLACDSAGKIFASPIENLVEGSAASAEPSDVRQVWVCVRVSGTEGVGLRAWTGRYLGLVDGDGGAGLRAEREGRGAEEEFVFEEAGTEGEGVKQEGDEDGVVAMGSGATAYHLRTARATYISLAPSALKPDVSVFSAKASKRGERTAVLVKMQARFKPRLSAAKKERAYEKISRSQIEKDAGRKLDDEVVKRLKRARKDGTYHEEMLDVRAKGHHDKFA